MRFNKILSLKIEVQITSATVTRAKVSLADCHSTYLMIFSLRSPFWAKRSVTVTKVLCIIAYHSIEILSRYDPEMGGFSRSPKFPSPPNMNFLFRIYAEDPSCDRSKQALKMCLLTLEMISLGGINDHVSKVSRDHETRKNTKTCINIPKLATFVRMYTLSSGPSAQP